MLRKSLIPVFTFLCISTYANAQTTMCFKQAHENMVTIENTKLDGGECASIKSATDMKKEGWSVSDIKMSPNGNATDFIYIFKKEAVSSENLNEEVLMSKLYAKIEAEKDAKEEKTKQELLTQNSNAGKTFYLKNCAICHGQKGELRARGVSNKINSLDHNEFQAAINDFVVGNRTGVMAILMSQYANLMDANDVKNVYTYLKFVNEEQK